MITAAIVASISSFVLMITWDSRLEQEKRGDTPEGQLMGYRPSTRDPSIFKSINDLMKTVIETTNNVRPIKRRKCHYIVMARVTC